MPKLLWRIYYEDGFTYSNLDGPFHKAPSDGVIGVVAANDEVGRRVFHGRDFYFILEDGTIGEADDLGPFLRKLGVVKFGRWVGDKPYKGTLAKMMNDPDFPKKSARYRDEDVTL